MKLEVYQLVLIILLSAVVGYYGRDLLSRDGFERSQDPCAGKMCEDGKVCINGVCEDTLGLEAPCDPGYMRLDGDCVQASQGM